MQFEDQPRNKVFVWIVSNRIDNDQDVEVASANLLVISFKSGKDYQVYFQSFLLQLTYLIELLGNPLCQENVRTYI